jgi:hypothetical protein
LYQIAFKVPAYVHARPDLRTRNVIERLMVRTRNSYNVL